ncbi:MAG: hypothetical protein Q9166_001366 [cf. Caloplaca sp. 2 TL-2023]
MSCSAYRNVTRPATALIFVRSTLTISSATHRLPSIAIQQFHASPYPQLQLSSRLRKPIEQSNRRHEILENHDDFFLPFGEPAVHHLESSSLQTRKDAAVKRYVDLDDFGKDESGEAQNIEEYSYRRHRRNLSPATTFPETSPRPSIESRLFQRPPEPSNGYDTVSVRSPSYFVQSSGLQQHESRLFNIQAPPTLTELSKRNGLKRSVTKRETWQIQKDALSSKFGSTGWAPRKRLSPDALEGIRALHAQFPEKYTTPVLASQFEVSAEAIRRVLKSKWRPNEEEENNRRQRWDKRGERIWGQMVALGVKPPKKWREVSHESSPFQQDCDS